MNTKSTSLYIGSKQLNQKRIRSPLKKQSMIFKQNSDEEDNQSEDEKMEVINLNYFKAKKHQKKFNLQQMLQQGKLAEDEVDHNPHFPSPTINTKLIHNIFQIYHSDRKETFIEDKVHGTAEKISKQTNQKLVNQILFNKMRQKRVVSQHELSNSTSNVLQSFKNLSSMFKSVNQIVDYHAVANQIRQSQAQITINREEHKNLERQQFNFNYIIEGRLNQIKLHSQEIYQYQMSLQKLRLENCKLRDHVSRLGEEIDQIKSKYNKQRQLALHQEDKLHPTKKWDRQQYFQTIDQNEQMELARIKTFYMEYQQQLQFNQSQLKREEEILQDIKYTKKQIKQDLAEFLKQVLQSEEIQQLIYLQYIEYQDLSQSFVTQADFPCYLDNQSRIFLISKAKLEINNDYLKLQIKENQIKQQQQQLGNRVNYEKKLFQVMNSISNMKKQKYTLKSFELQQQSDSKQDNLSQKLSNQSLQINNLDNQIIELEEQEIQRLQILYQGKQLPNSSLQKLIKTVQAEFGYKQMNQKLSIIIQNYDTIKSQVNKSIK
ncbi:unnamed protein product (macronuclear) [Paramecium tetraurelia]|uniref:Uncharacterized protein n=1 Tax=Paramecium tetraurelia TaxID=5888 RepID=A0CL02_PARTE|nr:uncharacterized protein GSPATT00008016001 [Paramecium tetraurelia]CAK71469.1 unnamed protein product [Paramecium tetraurelia]|eukprot:XP_001438866.1 hypothetical protein (macronuclear) [Paramecium tetraurelia strain d4-2]